MIYVFLKLLCHLFQLFFRVLRQAMHPFIQVVSLKLKLERNSILLLGVGLMKTICHLVVVVGLWSQQISIRLDVTLLSLKLLVNLVHSGFH